MNLFGREKRPKLEPVSQRSIKFNENKWLDKLMETLFWNRSRGWYRFEKSLLNPLSSGQRFDTQSQVSDFKLLK